MCIRDSLRPQLIEEVQTARAFGDLSENYEYKCAKQAKNRNDSRIRYLERMIRTAKVIEVKDQGDRAGLFDKVTIYNELAKQEMTLQIVTTLRQDALKGLISKESPVGKALLGRQVGDRIQVEVSPEVKYWVEIRAIEKEMCIRDSYWDLSLEGWTLARREEFPGFSHEIITKEVYIP